MNYEKLYRTYYMDVYSYVTTLVKNSHVAEEITQDVFVRAMKSKKPFEGRSQELTWLFAIAKNACTDEFKRQAKCITSDDENLLSSKDQTTNSLENLLENDETLFHIHTVLHDLEEPYKEVFQLRVFGELSFLMIGKLFDKTESWARVTYHRARLKLQERMVSYGE